MASLENKTAIVVLGNQLLKDHPALKLYPDSTIIMIEADSLFSKLPYHKHKLVLILAGMRNYKTYLKSIKRSVVYIDLKKSSIYKNELKKIIESHHFEQLVWMRSSDKGPNAMLHDLASKMNLEYHELENEQFVTPLELSKKWFSEKPKPIMDSFYRWQRGRMNILMLDDKPEGGKWSFDELNRQPLPKNIKIPALPAVTPANFESAVKDVESFYPSNAGSTKDFWLPTTYGEAEHWLKDFIKHRFSNFGPYEDAMSTGEAFLFHSVLSPMLNTGLLTPRQVLDSAAKEYKKGQVSINSYEGFVRQIIGWREYMHGLYMHKQDKIVGNYFGFKKKLEPWWYSGDIPEDLGLPVREVLKTTYKYGYNHHIERLMVLGNWFLLNGYDPDDVYRWFCSMYVDAYQWVMVANVYGMSQYADGGFTATKPYVSGGNYLQKMGKWWPSLKAAQDSEFTVLYWQFIKNNSDKFSKNPRMSLILAQAKKRKA
ncbi:MAG: cryptochrome/photolyase family protein [Candidatus Saccharibacteria bacterium]